MSSKYFKILILGGTYDGFSLATQLHDLGHQVITSLAGRTDNPKLPKGEIRIGGFSSDKKSSIGGLADYINKNAIDILIDATHPYADKISENAYHAANQAGKSRLVLYRKGWEKKAGDQWLLVQSEPEALNLLPKSARSFIALGAQHISPFLEDETRFYLFRMMDEPKTPFSHPNHQLSLGKPGNVDAEIVLLKQHEISHLICRNSGAEKVYAKIIAARTLGIPVMMIERGNPPQPPHAESVDEALKWVGNL
jgi:precorrin-6A/cobalt-precorrin-6A reductase